MENNKPVDNKKKQFVCYCSEERKALLLKRRAELAAKRKEKNN